MKNTVINLIIACTLQLASGCSSIMTHSGANQGYYSGTYCNIGMLNSDSTGWVMKSIVVLDLPFSAIADTLFLPYDYFKSDKDIDSPRQRVFKEEALNGDMAEIINSD